MKILLIGAGYVGTHVLNTWQNAHDQFIVSTTSKERVGMLQQIPSVEKVLLIDQLKEGVEECGALIISIAPKEGASYEETYLGTAKSIQTLLRERKRPLYLLCISSTSVYGDQEGPWVDEESELHPLSEKGKILIETEKTYQECGVLTCILRLGGIYGPGRDLENRAKSFSGKEMGGEGTRPTNHSHLEDIGRGIEFCVQRQCVGVYNLVSDAHPLREELYNNLCVKQGLPPPKWDGTASQRHGSNVSVSNMKIKEEGFIFLHPLID